MILKHLLHKLWGIEDSIISVIYLDFHSLTLRFPLKGDFFLDSSCIFNSHLVIDSNITTVIVNKSHPPENISDGYDLPFVC